MMTESADVMPALISNTRLRDSLSKSLSLSTYHCSYPKFISMATLDFTVSHKGHSYPISLLPDTTFDLLQAKLEELTSVPPSNQKLLYKGKKAVVNGEDTISHAGLKSGLKVQLLGSTAQELGELRQVESELQRRERVLRERASKPQPKLLNQIPQLRSTGSGTTSSLQFRFHRTEPLPHLPNPSGARAVLEKLANDPAVKHIMHEHQYSVGLLTELAPHEHPELLGLNVGAGQAIKLRLRTNLYDGFRPYRDIRRVLCHELAHNVWTGHDNNFKELNSQLNREVAEFERAAADGTRHLSDFVRHAYQPSSEQEAEAHMHVLGGVSSTSSMDSSPEERRRRILEATTSRLKREEEELESSCGTSGPSATHDKH
ncbi:WLM-domain-containing protein [Cytidiella melzeri]|nr:WLM-domain-containing protein [Cytidiella melzeri]